MTLPITSLGDGLTVSRLGLGCMGMSVFYGDSDEAGCVSRGLRTGRITSPDDLAPDDMAAVRGQPAARS